MINQKCECSDKCKQGGKSCCENNGSAKECCKNGKDCDCCKPVNVTSDQAAKQAVYCF